MKQEQELFVCEVMTVYDRRAWPHNLIGDLVPALTRSDDVEVARVSGLMLIELNNKGELPQSLAQRWVELFGDLTEVTCPS